MNEKEAIERHTAEGFLSLYNAQTNSSYEIVTHSDAPDFFCRDKTGCELKLEIPLTENRSGDIKAALGRSNARNLDALKRHNEAVRKGKAKASQWSSCLQGEVLDMIVSRIQNKLYKDYGPNTALVVRDTCPLSWNWNMVLKSIRASLDLKHNPFDKGIWIISNSKDEIFRVL